MNAVRDQQLRSPSRRLGTGYDQVVPFAEGGDRVLVAGDWHGDLSHARLVIAAASEMGVGTIVQLGDLGVLFPGTQGARFSRGLEAALDAAGVSLVFIDGNHDNHERLRALPVGTSGFARVDQHVFYAPRGARWAWAGKRFGALGGAFSVDRKRRRPGVTVWADLEELTQQDVARLGGEPLDVLLTHEAPAGTKLESTLVLPVADRVRSEQQRELVLAAVDACWPAVAFHGHWHQRRSGDLVRADGGVTRVHSLGANGDTGNWVILSLADLSITDPRGE